MKPGYHHVALLRVVGTAGVVCLSSSEGCELTGLVLWGVGLQQLQQLGLSLYRKQPPSVEIHRE